MVEKAQVSISVMAFCIYALILLLLVLLGYVEERMVYRMIVFGFIFIVAYVIAFSYHKKIVGAR